MQTVFVYCGEFCTPMSLNGFFYCQFYNTIILYKVKIYWTTCLLIDIQKTKLTMNNAATHKVTGLTSHPSIGRDSFVRNRFRRNLSNAWSAAQNPPKPVSVSHKWIMPIMLHLTDLCCALFVVLSTQQHNIEDGLIQEFVSPSDE